MNNVCGMAGVETNWLPIRFYRSLWFSRYYRNLLEPEKVREKTCRISQRYLYQLSYMNTSKSLQRQPERESLDGN